MFQRANKLLSAVAHPRLAAARLRHKLHFDELLVMHELKQAGVLDGLTTVIDAGAHHGEYARLCSYMIPGAKVICFEPVPDTYQILRTRTANYQNIEAHCVALGNTIGDSSMYVSRLDAASSLLEMTPIHKELWPISSETKPIEISVTTLDHFVEANPIAGEIFLKADVQGYELELLKGAKSLLRHVRLIRLELSYSPLYKGAATFSETCAFLEGAGFRFLTMVGSVSPHERKLPVQGDFVFLKSRTA